MAAIFISYANSDQVHAKALAEALEQLGWSVWWDREVVVGRVWDEVIEEEIATARAVLVLWTPQSVASAWVKNEARDAKARRMGIMYLIWDDRMYAAWNGFEPEPYLSSSCRKRAKCSTTLRHRDHLHVSLTRKGGRGATSWYAGRVAG